MRRKIYSREYKTSEEFIFRINEYLSYKFFTLDIPYKSEDFIEIYLSKYNETNDKETLKNLMIDFSDILSVKNNNEFITYVNNIMNNKGEKDKCKI